MITHETLKTDSRFMQVDLKWAIDARTRYLIGLIAFYTMAVNEIVKTLPGKHSLAREMLFLWIAEFQGKINSFQSQMLILKPRATRYDGYQNTITDATITVAKKYPIEKLLPNSVSNNLTRCFAHDDKHPSMSIKNNKVKCFSCGYSGSSVDVIMHTHSCNFKRAVLFITGR